MPIKKTSNTKEETTDSGDQIKISFLGLKIKYKNSSQRGVTIFMLAIAFFLILFHFFPN